MDFYENPEGLQFHAVPELVPNSCEGCAFHDGSIQDCRAVPCGTSEGREQSVVWVSYSPRVTPTTDENVFIVDGQAYEAQTTIGICDGCAFYDFDNHQKPCRRPPGNHGRCVSYARKDGRSIIWVKSESSASTQNQPETKEVPVTKPMPTIAELYEACEVIYLRSPEDGETIQSFDLTERYGSELLRLESEDSSPLFIPMTAKPIRALGEGWYEMTAYNNLSTARTVTVGFFKLVPAL